MYQQNVKLYGGPRHGKIVAVERGRSRVEVVGAFVSRIGDPWCSPGDAVYYDPTVYTTYWIRQYQEKRYCPMRSRSVCVGVLEGVELTPREERELAHDMRQIPWEFPPVSFIDQFDEWMAQTMYRVCGYLEWQGRRVYE